MGIFSRFMDIVNSNINSLLDKAEDPEKMLRLMIQEMEDTLIELKSNAASAIAHRIKLERQADEARATVERWQQRAMLAMERGKEDLAREALIEKRRISEKLDMLQMQIDEAFKSVDSAKSEIDTLEDKLAQAKGKLKLLKEKEERARAEQKSEELRRRDMNQHFQEMEEKIDRMNAWADVNSSSKSPAEDRFADLERDEEIEKELQALREKAGK